jgi:hypothetical protein
MRTCYGQNGESTLPGCEVGAQPASSATADPIAAETHMTDTADHRPVVQL